ncbi:putative pectinesterase 63 [Aristolochia californica]|uniref:putative pectinesterase 63 n=1 Tax=Aristolochia californica TaxID=171875 RepID=UPI0035DB7DF5
MAGSSMSFPVIAIVIFFSLVSSSSSGLHVIARSANLDGCIFGCTLALQKRRMEIQNSFNTKLGARSGDLDDCVFDCTVALEERKVEIQKNVGNKFDLELLSAEAHPVVITVRKDGKGNFRTITDAINSIPPRNARRRIIMIGKGVYREKITVDRMKPFVTFYGQPNEMPTISFDGTAAEYGTWNSATVAVDSHYFMAVNIVFENSAPMPTPGAIGAQAVAMRISGDKAAFYNCRFHGYQDTLLDDKGKHYFKNCYIRGLVDFIFGNGRSRYEDCEIHAVARGETAITAQARETLADKSGFVFVHCRITGTGSAYLGRAWKPSSRVVFAYTYMGELINPKGWDTYGFKNRERTVFYGEYQSAGPGANTSNRASFGKELTNEQVKPFTSMSYIRADTWLLPPPNL